MAAGPLSGIASLAASRAASPATVIRVLVVDDSALVRQAVRRHLEADPAIEVVDTAHDGLDGLLKVERLQPDVVTMDVEMPNLDGLSALRLLMARFPRPVIMLSSLTDHGTAATVQALALGAVDYIAKPSPRSGGISTIAVELVAKVKQASGARVRQTRSATAPPPAPAKLPQVTPNRASKLLVVGTSTGGPRALSELFASLPADLPCATIVVQHLPAGFTHTLAERLDQNSALTVAEATDGESIAVGRALLAPGGRHLRLSGRRVVLSDDPRRNGVRPAVDTTLEAAAAEFGPSMLAVILTGMGQDGTEGARAVKAAGGQVLAEAEETCVVFGMPQSVIAAGLADGVVPLHAMPAAIVRAVKALPVRPGWR